MSDNRAMPRFSIVVPAYNAAAHLETSLASALAQDIGAAHFEVLLIDDRSTDSTMEIAAAMAARNGNLRLAATPRNGGPGAARNVGVAQARGEWLVFLDSDDTLRPDALSALRDFIDTPANRDCDAVGFDWCYSTATDGRGARRDHPALALDRPGLIGKYLSLHMDGSVIYTAIRRGLVADHGVRFAPGYHEDVDYIFKVYWLARRVGYLDRVLYEKHQRPGSIVNTVSGRHFAGFFRAWREIGEFLAQADAGGWTSWQRFYRDGLVGVAATRCREIRARASDPGEAGDLYRQLYQGWLSILPVSGPVDFSTSPTKYYMIAEKFVSTMQMPELADEARAAAINGFMDEVMTKSWSCVDLHHSVFLATDQIRTCCKRFFVDGEMRGDVALLDLGGDNPPAVTTQSITDAKQALHTAINRGDKTACDGCPFMEFKDWGTLSPMSINYLSFEYHSVCNLKCTYCSDTYYGGLKAQYDVKALVDDFIARDILSPRTTVVWGGGEPVADKNFKPIIENLAERLPKASQRVLTNAVTFSPTVERLLAEGRITITTSIDAGTEATYTLVRGRNKLRKTMITLGRYAAANPSGVTIKYIFTEGNESLEEVQAFVNLVRESGLLDCNFQISHDFKAEHVEEPVLVAMIAMYAMLAEAGCRVLFFDDLLRHRLVGLDAGVEDNVRRRLDELALGQALVAGHDYPDLAIWGAGWQAKYLLEHASFFKGRRPSFFVDSTPTKIGGEFLGIEIRDPRALLESDVPVLIAAAQAYPAIYGEFVRLGLPKSRLVTKLVI